MKEISEENLPEQEELSHIYESVEESIRQQKQTERILMENMESIKIHTLKHQQKIAQKLTEMTEEKNIQKSQNFMILETPSFKQPEHLKMPKYSVPTVIKEETTLSLNEVQTQEQSPDHAISALKLSSSPIHPVNSTMSGGGTITENFKTPSNFEKSDNFMNYSRNESSQVRNKRPSNVKEGNGERKACNSEGRWADGVDLRKSEVVNLWDDLELKKEDGPAKMKKDEDMDEVEIVDKIRERMEEIEKLKLLLRKKNKTKKFDVGEEERIAEEDEEKERGTVGEKGSKREPRASPTKSILSSGSKRGRNSEKKKVRFSVDVEDEPPDTRRWFEKNQRGGRLEPQAPLAFLSPEISPYKQRADGSADNPKIDSKMKEPKFMSNLSLQGKKSLMLINLKLRKSL
jgi:hypothetical protein